MYITPTGTEISFVFDTTGYIAPAGDNLQFIFQRAFIEMCEDGFTINESMASETALYPILLDTVQAIDGSIYIISCQPILVDQFLFNLDIVTLLKTISFLDEVFNPQEALIFYTPSGIIQLLSDPFTLTESPSAGVTLAEVLSTITLTETNQTQVTLTEVTESVTITEVL